MQSGLWDVRPGVVVFDNLGKERDLAAVRLATATPRNEIERCLDRRAPMVEPGARPCRWWLQPLRPLRP